MERELYWLDQITEEKATKLLRELVRTPSISKNEKELAEKVAHMCDELGMKASIDRHGNVIASVCGEKPGVRLALNTHLDTVDVTPGWTMDPFAGEIKNGKLYGLGACDCKGSMAAQLLALEAIRKTGLPISGELVFTAVVQEEVQSENAKGTVKLLKDGFRADMAIVGEPTNLEICLGCEGMVEVEIVTKGKSAHASNPEAGINAIQNMIRVIEEVNKLEVGFHPLLGKGSINVGVIAGGLRSSMVPDLCKVKIGRFVVPGETGPAFLNEVEAILNELKERDHSLEAEAVLTCNSNAAVVDADTMVVKHLINAYETVMSSVPVLTGTRAHLDSDFLINIGGIPTVAFGPGDMRKAHEANEYIDIPEVLNAAKIYAATIWSILAT